ncbi:Zinc-finger double domain-containing protein [Cladophialophora immunda]|nr:Zinc-finger double domain-containing protein [Cladophialophora immunda]
MPRFKCLSCGKQYSKAEHLKRHQRSHTQERPFQCNICDKSFSRSDVLRRHQKNHPTRRDGRSTRRTPPNEPLPELVDTIVVFSQNEDAAHEPEGDVEASSPTFSTRQVHLSATSQQRRANSHVSERQDPYQDSSVLPDADSYIAEEPLELTWDSTMVQCAASNASSYIAIPAQSLGLEPVPSPSWQDEALHDADHSISQIETTLQPQMTECQPSASAEVQEPPRGGAVDLQELLLFHDISTDVLPLSSSLLPTLQQASRLNIFSPESAPLRGLQENSDPRKCFTSLVSTERFGKIQRRWHSHSSRPIRLMPDLWRNLAESKQANLYNVEIPQTCTSQSSEKRISRWGFDEECRQQMQLTLDSLTCARSSWLPESPCSLESDRYPSSTGTERLTLPSTETCEVALEIYFHQFHPTLPVIHPPTFSAKDAPFPLLFVLCLLGSSILGSPSAIKLVSSSFTMILELVETELQSDMARRGSTMEQLGVLTTALLVLNLAAITGQTSRCMAQVEMLYVNLMALAQWHGLFFVQDDLTVNSTLDAIDDEERRWHSWAKIECVKRLIIGIVESDIWFASHFATCPMIRPETIRLLPPSDMKLFHADTAALWSQLRPKYEADQGPYIVEFYVPLLSSRTPEISALLTLLQHRVYETKHRLTCSNEDHRCLEPWRLYKTTPSDAVLVDKIVGLPSAIPLSRADINGVVSWHTSCILMTANMRHFEDAAGCSGTAMVAPSLRDIATWACTPTARRAVVHAAQIFKLLFYRRVSDMVSVHTVAALFKSALVLSFYLLNAPETVHSANHGTLELFDDVDWSVVGSLGVSNHPGALSGPVDAAAAKDDPVGQFIETGGGVSITGIFHAPGFSSCRRVLLHAADLMQTMGKWRSRTLSQILHLLTDDLMDVDSADNYN